MPTAAVMCSTLESPLNGQVHQQSQQYQSTVSYTCNEGYLPMGVTTRTCESNGSWSGQQPTCEREQITTL